MSCKSKITCAGQEDRTVADERAKQILFLLDVNREWAKRTEKIEWRLGTQRTKYSSPDDGREAFLSMQAQVQMEIAQLSKRLKTFLATTNWTVDDFGHALDIWEVAVRLSSKLISDVQTYINWPSHEAYSEEHCVEDNSTLSNLQWSRHYMVKEVLSMARDRLQQLTTFVYSVREKNRPYNSSLHVLCEGAIFMADVEQVDVFHCLKTILNSAPSAYEKRTWIRSCKSCVALYMVSAYIGMSHCSLGMCHGVQYRGALAMMKFILKLLAQAADIFIPELVTETLPLCRAAVAKLKNLHGPEKYPHPHSCSCPLNDRDRVAMEEAHQGMKVLFTTLQSLYPDMRLKRNEHVAVENARMQEIGNILVCPEDNKLSPTTHGPSDDTSVPALTEDVLLGEVKDTDLCQAEIHAFCAVTNVVEAKWLSDSNLTRLLSNHVFPVLSCEREERHKSISAKQQAYVEYREPANVEPLHWNPLVGLQRWWTLGSAEVIPRLSNGLTVDEMSLKVAYDSAVGKSSLVWESVEPCFLKQVKKIDKKLAPVGGESALYGREKRYTSWLQGQEVFAFRAGSQQQSAVERAVTVVSFKSSASLTVERKVSRSTVFQNPLHRQDTRQHSVTFEEQRPCTAKVERRQSALFEGRKRSAFGEQKQSLLCEGKHLASVSSISEWLSH